MNFAQQLGSLIRFILLLALLIIGSAGLLAVLNLLSWPLFKIIAFKTALVSGVLLAISLTALLLARRW